MFGHRPLTLLAMLLSATAALAASEPTLPTPKIDVGVDEEFQLARQETALVRDLNLLVTVTGLSYTRCPKGGICVVPDGPVVVFEVRDAATGALAFTENNRASAPSRFPTFVRYVASDGETYARLAAHRTVDWCGRQVEKTAATWCWKRTAELARDAVHCARLVDKAAHSSCVLNVARITGNPQWCELAPDGSACYESIAAQVARPELCSKVSQPQSHCLVQAVAKNGEIERCAKMRPPRVDCYIAAARQANSLEVCERLKDPYRWECNNVMKGERVKLPATP